MHHAGAGGTRHTHTQSVLLSFWASLSLSFEQMARAPWKRKTPLWSAQGGILPEVPRLHFLLAKPALLPGGSRVVVSLCGAGMLWDSRWNPTHGGFSSAMRNGKQDRSVHKSTDKFRQNRLQTPALPCACFED